VRCIGGWQGRGMTPNETDKRGATEILEWQHIDADLTGYGNPPSPPAPAGAFGAVPCYSQDIEAAWQVVERLRSEGWIVRVQEMPDGLPFLTGSGWGPHEGEPIHCRASCTLYPSPSMPDELRRWAFQRVGLAETAPLAICRTALAWAEAKEKWA
jgi:Phage ABA sandwich domain